MDEGMETLLCLSPEGPSHAMVVPTERERERERGLNRFSSTTVRTLLVLHSAFRINWL